MTNRVVKNTHAEKGEEEKRRNKEEGKSIKKNELAHNFNFINMHLCDFICVFIIAIELFLCQKFEVQVTATDLLILLKCPYCYTWHSTILLL